MASSINASTSGAGGVITTADATGILQLQAGGTTIATVSSTGLALNTGNITLPSGAAPTFYAYNSSVQSIAHNTLSKVQLQSELYDTNNNFDSTTNYRFTPTIAGYYHISAAVSLSSLTANVTCQVNKNGSPYVYSFVGVGWAGIQSTSASLSSDVYMNGSTDYLEVYVYQASGGAINTNNYSSLTFFSGYLARSA